MRAVIMERHGGPEVLTLSEQPMPAPGVGEVLIEVKAAAVNPADGKWRAGMFASFLPVTFPHVLGYDVAGIVRGGEGFAPGSRVACMLDPITKGGYADYVAAKAEYGALLPDTLSFEVAAALPTAGLTGLQLVERAIDAKPGERILLTGALGAVGRFALYAARERGAEIIAAVRATHRQEALALGAAHVLALGAEDWLGAPFDHVIDTVGGEAVAGLCRRLRPGGKIATAATTPIPADGLPAAPEFFSVTPSGEGIGRLAAAAARGAFAVPIARVMRLADAAEAQRLTDAGGLGGKIVLTL